MGFGLAGATLVGQSLGRKDPQDAQRWGWDVVKISSLFVISVTVHTLSRAIFKDVFMHYPPSVKENEVLSICFLPFSVIFLTDDHFT